MSAIHLLVAGSLRKATTTTIMSDGFVSADRNLNGWTPDTSNTEGNSWVGVPGAGEDVIQYGTLAILTHGLFVGTSYNVTSRKNFTLTFNGVYFNAGDGQTYWFWVRDNCHPVTNEAGANAWAIKFVLGSGNVVVTQRQTVNGVEVGSETSVGTITGVATDGSTVIAFVMGSDDSCQVKHNGTNVGSPFTLSGSTYGFRMASTNGAVNIVTAA